MSPRNIEGSNKRNRIRSERGPGTPESGEDIGLPNHTRVFYIRHSMAKYGPYLEKVASQNPHGALDIEAQTQPDLTDTPERDGVAFAKTQAERLLATMDLHTDTLYIVSSDQRRALDTASIYADLALEKGFTVVTHDKTGTAIAGEVGKGKVRSLETLSLNDGEAVSDSVFNPKSQMPQINWGVIDPAFKKSWDEARLIVEEYERSLAEKGLRPSWGDSAFHCADKVKHLLPSVKTPEELEKQFGKMLRLAKFAESKQTPDGMRINVLAFGHENAPGAALERETGSHTLGNCEAFEVVDGKPVRVPLPE